MPAPLSADKFGEETACLEIKRGRLDAAELFAAASVPRWEDGSSQRRRSRSPPRWTGWAGHRAAGHAADARGVHRVAGAGGAVDCPDRMSTIRLPRPAPAGSMAP